MNRTMLLPCAALGTLLAGIAWGTPPSEPSGSLKPFHLSQVRLLDSPFREAQQRDRKYLLSLDADRLLHNFRVNAGLPSSAQPLGGWETKELRGHTTGHYLSACSLMYASTGDDELKRRVDLLVDALAACQQAGPSQGFHQGYLSAFPESFIDRVETRQKVWAPWYTLHKIMAGLLDAYQWCGNRQALDVLVRMADWIKFRVDRLGPEKMQESLKTEFGGMNEVLSNLYAVTGNSDHLRMAQAFDHAQVFDPLARGEDRLDGLHANTQIPKMIGAAREYELTGDARYRRIASYFWDRVALNRSYAIGGHSDREHFFPVDRFAEHLGPITAETCNTYNMLKLTRHLFAWEPSARTMDFYERALYNHILASQDPAQGMFVYYMSLKPGHFKTYSTPLDSFWCCVGTGMENHAKYGDTIYFHQNDSLYVNLFIPSELTWKDRGLVLKQETRFPEDDRTRLTFGCQKPVRLTLKIRWPSWAESMAIEVNGKSRPVAGSPGSYATLEGPWKDGDAIDVRLPMRLHLEALPGVADTVAVLYGPIVLAGRLGREGLEKVSPYAQAQSDLATVPTPEPPALVCRPEELLDHIRPMAGAPLEFHTQGTGRPRDVRLSPLYRVHHERYSVYWPLVTEEQWEKNRLVRQAEETRLRALAARTVDQVQPGDQDSENSHQLAGEKTTSGQFQGHHWRHATGGGWFGYRIAVPPDQPVTLVATYWGSDSGRRTFDVLVDGTKIGTENLKRNQPDAFFDQTYPLPPALTAGKKTVTVRWQAHPGCLAGGLFGVRVLKDQ